MIWWWSGYSQAKIFPINLWFPLIPAASTPCEYAATIYDFISAARNHPHTANAEPRWLDHHLNFRNKKIKDFHPLIGRWAWQQKWRGGQGCDECSDYPHCGNYPPLHSNTSLSSCLWLWCDQPILLFLFFLLILLFFLFFGFMAQMIVPVRTSEEKHNLCMEGVSTCGRSHHPGLTLYYPRQPGSTSQSVWFPCFSSPPPPPPRHYPTLVIVNYNKRWLASQRAKSHWRSLSSSPTRSSKNFGSWLSLYFRHCTSVQEHELENTLIILCATHEMACFVAFSHFFMRK